MTELATFRVDDADVAALRDVLAAIKRAGYCESGVRDRLGLSDLTALLWRAVPIYRVERLANRDALAVAIDLFLLQGIIPTDELDRLTGKAGREVLVRAGLVAINDKGFACARASLYPVGDSLFFSDLAWPMLPHPGIMSVSPDHVMFIGTDSHWLARTTVRRRATAALDLCTGSGVHALLAARHSERVTAVDINPRAALCTRFNAQASGVTNLDVAVGDLFEPVRGKRFDLITANPPFVPSPVNTLKYRDGGRSGEDVQRRIVEGLPQYLAPGGIAQIVTELGERDGEQLTDRLRGWLGDAAIDIHILRLKEFSAASYAIGHAAGSDESYGAFLDSVHDWANNLREQRYVRVVAVLLAFKWSDAASGAPWARSETAQPPVRDAGFEIESIFFAERLARNTDLRQILERSRVQRAGPIGLQESSVLGNELQAKPQAQLLGKVLSVTHLLEPLEREILAQLKKPLSLPELFTLMGELRVDKEAVYAAIGLLLKRGLVTLTPGDAQPS